jgi:hypothetical protein
MTYGTTSRGGPRSRGARPACDELVLANPRCYATSHHPGPDPDHGAGRHVARVVHAGVDTGVGDRASERCEQRRQQR